jgi:hypothetical protein
MQQQQNAVLSQALVTAAAATQAQTPSTEPAVTETAAVVTEVQAPVEAAAPVTEPQATAEEVAPAADADVVETTTVSDPVMSEPAKSYVSPSIRFMMDGMDSALAALGEVMITGKTDEEKAKEIADAEAKAKADAEKAEALQTPAAAAA